MLAKLAAKKDFWGAGSYPADILFCDKGDVINPEIDVQAIAVRKDYASSFRISASVNQSKLEDPDCDVFYMKNNYGKLSIAS
jgi:hypothetical protein